MSLRWIGPVELGPIDHGDPEFTLTAGQSEQRTATITGRTPWPIAQQLIELCDNPARMTTVGTSAGVLETLWFDDDLLRFYSGWYLLGAFQFGQATAKDSVTPIVPFSLPVVHLGDRQIVVSRTTRIKDTDFAVAAEPLVVDPYYGSWLVMPSGVSVDREIDTTFPHETAPLSIPASDGGVGGGGLLPASSLFPSASLFPAT